MKKLYTLLPANFTPAPAEGFSAQLTKKWNFMKNKRMHGKAMVCGLVFLFSVQSSVLAAVNTYSFAQASGTYTPLISETVLWAASFDDEVSAVITIPSFTFNGTAYTTMYVSANGWITLGDISPENTDYYPISSTSAYSGLISAFGADMGPAGTGTPKVSYNANVSGEIVVQWQDVKQWSSSHLLSFQIRLNPSAGIIRIVYGGTITANNASVYPQVGIRGGSNTDFSNRSVIRKTNIWAASTAGVANNATCEFRTGLLPVAGQTYTWTPPPPPSISGLGSASGCVGTSITINGTNLTGATAANVKIGGTPVSSITSNSGTQIVAVIGTGTTGFVTVLTAGGTATSSPATFTVNAMPTTPAITAGGPTTFCSVGSVTLTSSTGTTYLWSTGATSSIINVTAAGSYTVQVTNAGGCLSAVSAPIVVTVNALPSAVTITPSAPTICNGTTQPLTATNYISPSLKTTSSGTISVTIPDNNSTGVTSTLSVSGIPLYATITDISINFNTTMTYDGDLIFNLKAPNNNILNLVNRAGGSGDNFTNTVISSSSSNLLSAGSAPFTGTYAADAVNNVGPTSYLSNVTSFSGLTSTPNGNWVLAARDVANIDIGTITSWSITITYTLPSITWSPTTELYTDAGATVAYTGGAATTVYSKPTSSKTYTATATTDAGCSSSGNVIVTVNNVSTAPTSISGITAICGGSSTTLTATGGTLGTGGTYQWGTGGTLGLNIIPSATAASYTTPDLTSNATYWVRKTDPAPCNTVTGGLTASITINAIQWQGGATGDWEVAGNWCGGIPSSSTDVLIPINTTVHITSSPGSSSECNNLTIATGALPDVSGTLIVDAGKALTVNGALSNGGTLTVKSDGSNGTGSLITKGSVTGNATVERYIGGASWGWHFLSSPVAAQAISPEFVASPTGTSEDFYMWYEPLLLWVNFKNESVEPKFSSKNGANFVPGRGYLVAYETTGTTKNFQGTLNSGSVSIPLTMGGSGDNMYFNLVGNPYPCSLDWDAVSGWDWSSLAGTQKSYWVWNDASGNYGAYISGSYGFGTNGVTNYIPVGQGFMVMAAATGNLAMGDGVKAHSAQAFLKKGSTSNDEFRLKLSCDVNAYSDEAIVAFSNSVSDGGADKFNSMYADAPELWSVKNGNKYSINFMGDISSAEIVPLAVKAGVAGSYTLTASQVESFAGNSAVTLEDRSTGTFTDLGTTPIYTFHVNAPAIFTDRFFLHFLDVTGIVNPDIASNFTMYTMDGVLNIQSLQKLGGKIAVIDMQGRTIATGRIEAGATTRINMNGKTGVYIVSVLTSRGIINTKVLVK
ncbi:MAG: T9SS type A sorting domain-containing protein [Bacteroidales bacterium]|nr:T9SS type A sorting domain-containing protein [Bacteroidales bacterium]